MRYRCPMLGRYDLLDTVRTALRAGADGVGGVIVVEGPAGIGKSRLLAVASAEACALDIVVAAGQATELDRLAPLAPLLTALRGSDPPVLGKADWTALRGFSGPETNRYLLIDRLVDVIERYAHSRAVLVVLDDAHWADEMTALALRILIPALQSSPVLWLLARRSVPTRSPAHETLDWLLEQGAQRVSLGPLPDDSVAELCQEMLGGTPEESVLSLASGCGGNPFLLEELLATLRDQGRIQIHNGRATVLPGDLPSDFVSIIDHRLRGLSESARSLLNAGAVLRRPFTVHEAAGLVAQPVMSLIPATSEVIEADILISRGSELAFRHDLIRKAVYARLVGAVREALHREAVSVLREEGRAAAEIAEHLVYAPTLSKAQDVQLLLEAVGQAAPHAPSAAADILLRILSLVGDDDPRQPGLVADTVRQLAAASRVVEARALAEPALSGDLEPTIEAAITLGLAEALKHAGQDAVVVEYTQRVLAKPDVPDAARAQLLAIQAHALIYDPDVDRADEVAAQAVEIGSKVGEHAAAVFGAVARSVVAVIRGRLDDAVVLADSAVRRADTEGGEAHRRHPRLWLARALGCVDRFTEADALFESGLREIDQFGTAWILPLWHFSRAELRMEQGHIDDCEAEAKAGLRVAEQLGGVALKPALWALLAQLAVRRGDLDTAHGDIRRAEDLVARGFFIPAECLSWGRALIQDAEGKPEAAASCLAEVYDALPDRLTLLAERPWAGPRLVRIAQRAGRSAWARAAAKAARALAERNPSVASFAGAAAHAEGLRDADGGALLAAVEAYTGSPRPLARACAMEDAGRAENQAGGRRAARQLLGEALALYERCGATADAARVQSELRNFGGRSKAASGQTRARSGWAALTRSELPVVRLIASGLTNREVAAHMFLSPHTVDSHLRHAFTKLDVSSRVQLTRLVMIHEPDFADQD
jgi:ATP/maltotriose-dependent transcriptional regulator MalT